jgi:hypothetical protein
MTCLLVAARSVAKAAPAPYRPSARFVEAVDLIVPRSSRNWCSLWDIEPLIVQPHREEQDQ